MSADMTLSAKDDDSKRLQTAGGVGNIVLINPSSEVDFDRPIDFGATSPSIGEGKSLSGVRGAIRGYDLIEVIGRGGQGVVVRAVQLSTRKMVAVKILPGGRFTGDRALKRFEREVSILAAFDHPHIVGILDRGTMSDGSAFLVMPYIKGADLSLTISNLGEPRAIASTFAKIAAAVGALHAQKIYHRDLKPTNIRIDVDGEPRILDFGLAQDGGPAAHTVVTHTGQVLGSLAWTSPEQARGETESICASSDVYSIGVMLFVAAHGYEPYLTAGPMHEVVRRICRSPLKIGVPAPLGEVIRRCMEKNPSSRYPTALELAADLKWVASGGSSRFFARGTRSRRWSLRLTAVLCLATTVTIGLLKTRGYSVPSESMPIRLPTYVNSAEMRLLQIPSGSFFMGSPLTEKGHSPSEVPHLVHISDPFWISVTPVTRRQYDTVLNLTPGPAWTDDLPVTKISWNDAQRFCTVLGGREHRNYRLPTEAEWEYSSRASSAPVPFSLPNLADVAWFAENSGGMLHPVGQKRSNRWGLLDPEGNVWQYCGDKYQGRGTPDETNSKVIKGGSFLSPAEQCRCASRRPISADTKNVDVGFRVVCDNF